MGPREDNDALRIVAFRTAGFLPLALLAAAFLTTAFFTDDFAGDAPAAGFAAALADDGLPDATAILDVGAFAADA